MSQQMQAGQVPGYGGPVYVLNATMKRSTGREAQLANIEASISVANIVRTCLGPRAMLKMMLDPIGGVAITNDGNAILREIDVTHPAAKSMIELARAQDEEVQDGTTSVIILGKQSPDTQTSIPLSPLIREKKNPFCGARFHPCCLSPPQIVHPCHWV
eukprot:TRINITY_DN2170_c1_g1_i1.p1 TRINITY_DN2170_c1_g1~~TRINITY_DN2170_c1_g1_i1.p1  ORF type:complete len:158 (+),score=27.51 TRINITY_DN2170_c1_g1_i1:163-636(+)